MTAMTEVAVTDLAGEALNWAVGTAEGLNMFVAPTVYGVPVRTFVNRLRGEKTYGQRYDPSNDWATGGPLIDKHYPTFSFANGLIRAEVIVASGEPFSAIGPNYLIAACLAIVSARLGETVSVPAELMPCA